MQLALLSTNFLIAEPCLSFETCAGITTAQIDEELYYLNDTSLCSLLEWKEQLLYTLSLKTSFETDSFFTGTDFSFSSNIIDSQMRDSDFLTNGIKYSYSIHDAECYALDAGLSFGKKFTWNSFSLIPVLRAEYAYDSFTGGEGRGWKGNAAYTSDGKTHSWDSPEAHYFPDGKMHINGVDYSLHSLNIFAGLELRKTFLSKVTLSAQFYASPFSCFFVEDVHKDSSGGQKYHDVFYGVLNSIEYEAALTCPLTKKLFLTTGIRGKHILHQKGKAYKWFKEESRDVPMGQESGIKALKHTVYTGIKFGL